MRAFSTNWTESWSRISKLKLYKCSTWMSAGVINVSVAQCELNSVTACWEFIRLTLKTSLNLVCVRKRSVVSDVCSGQTKITFYSLHNCVLWKKNPNPTNHLICSSLPPPGGHNSLFPSLSFIMVNVCNRTWPICWSTGTAPDYTYKINKRL